MDEKTKKIDNQHDQIIACDISQELKECYIDYAMSVIVARAIPDCRDGLKPVQRRILYSMKELGMAPNTKFKKSALIVGHAMGRYHPHGDMAIYDTLVRMAQPFSLRYMLVNGQGNFGSIDGDPAAAQRYCVTGDSLILTSKGLIEIGSISNKREAKIDLNISNFQSKKVKADKFFNSWKHPTITIKNKMGYEITGSYNHPVLCLEKNVEQKPTLVWKTLEEIKKGDYTIINRSSNLFSDTNCDLTQYFPQQNNRRDKITLPKVMTKELAFILGALVSEGSFHQGNILFINKDINYYNTVKTLLKKVFPEIKIYERQLSKCKSWEMTIYQRYLVEFFINIGLTNVKSHQKEIPSTILRSQKEIIAEFLKSLYEWDGGVVYRQDKRHGGECICIDYDSKSNKLIKQLKILLLNFGIATAKPIRDKRNECMKLEINGQNNCYIFKNTINFFSEHKRSILSKIDGINNNRMSKNDFVPFLNDYLRANYPQTFIKKHNLDRYNKLQLNYWTIKSLLTQSDQVLIENILKYNFLFSPVEEKIKNRKSENVYSIRVANECHSFVANGFVNHNTECRMMSLAEQMFEDIEKETVEFVPNYDNNLKEPKVLPTKFPQLLLNGTTGIAVGMATNIPPHNLSECMDAAIFLADNPDCNTDDLMQFIKGPDFPTGGTIYGWNEIKEAYSTGKGKVLIRGTAEIMENGNTNQIVITEIPYMVNKSELIKKIAGLIEDKKIINIKDIRDESDKNGLTITIDLKREANPKNILNQLYKYTDLEKYFHVNSIALIDDGLQPELLSLKDMLNEFLSFRKNVVFHRTQFLLRKAKERLHILEGLKTALDHIDEIIDIIKKSENKEDANLKLCKRFKFTEIQANVILETKLQAIAKLEKMKILDELKARKNEIDDYEMTLKDQKKVIKIVKQEFAEIKEKFGDIRRTKLVKGMPDKIEEADLIPDENVLITMSQNGYIKRMNSNIFRTQQRGGKGIIAYNAGDNDVLEHILNVSTKDNLLFFSDRGKVYQTSAYDINDGSRESKGKAIQNFIDITSDENVSVVLGYNQEMTKSNKYLIMATKNGVIKKTELEEFKNIRKNGLLSIKLDRDDLLKWADFSSGDDLVCLITKQGQSITFSEKDVRSMGRSSSGVTGIKLGKEDEVVGMMVIKKSSNKSVDAIVSLSQFGFGKKTAIKEYRIQKRGGSGIKNFKVTTKTGLLVSSKLANTQEILITISKNGLILQTELSAIPCLSRTTQGVRIMKLDEGDQVSEIVLL